MHTNWKHKIYFNPKVYENGWIIINYETKQSFQRFLCLVLLPLFAHCVCLTNNAYRMEKQCDSDWIQITKVCCVGWQGNRKSGDIGRAKRRARFPLSIVATMLIFAHKLLEIVRKYSKGNVRECIITSKASVLTVNTWLLNLRDTKKGNFLIFN